MPIASTAISAHRVRKRRVRCSDSARSLGPECAALLVVALPLAWLTWKNGSVDPADQTVAFGWILGCAAVASLVSAKENRFALPWPAILIALFPLLQLLPLGNMANLHELYSEFAAHSIPPPQQVSIYPYATIHVGIVLAGCCALFAIARALACHSTRTFLILAVSLLAVGLAQTVLGIQQHLATQTLEDPASRFAQGTFVNRDHYAVLMEGCFGLALGLALSTIAGRDWKRWFVGRESLFTVGALLASAACGMAVVLSYSRMGILVLAAMGVTAVAATLLYNRRATTLLAIAGLAAAAVVSAAGLRGLSDRFAELVAQHGDPGRLSMWRDTLRIAPDFLWTGSGLGTFAFAFRRSEPYLPLKTIDHAHSDYLEFLVELGLPGASLLLGAVAFVFVGTLRSLRAMRDIRTRWMAFGCLLGAGGILLHAAADFPLQIPALAALAAMLLGLARGLASPDPTPSTCSRMATGFTCASLCLMSILFHQGYWSSRDAAAIGQSAHNAAMQGAIDEAQAGYVSALIANPFAAAIWIARAELTETAGAPEQAVPMLDLAHRLEPFTVRTQWALANAYLRTGNRPDAIRHFALLAASAPEMRVAVMNAAWTGGIPAADIAAHIVPAQGQAAGEFLNYLVRRKTWTDLPSAYAAFDDAVKQSIPIELLRYTFDQAFAAGEAQTYIDLWKESPGRTDDADGLLTIPPHHPPESFGLSGCGLAWSVRPHQAVATRVITDGDNPAAIEVAFTRPQNVHYSHLSRDFVVRPSSSYSLHAEVRADDLTSSQGVRLLVNSSKGAIAESQPIRGTIEWTPVRLSFRTGPNDHVLRLTIVRYPSTTFDRDITGRFQLRSVGIVTH